MKRALPVLVVSFAALVPVWRYSPSVGTTAQAPPVPAAVPHAPAPAPEGSSAPPGGSPGRQVIAGPTIPTEKGDVQVELTLAGGRISEVRALKAPPHPQTTSALPRLIEETLRKQSADIDTVTGATVTSDGYRRSLQAALDLRDES
ncbi:FMN-binding protein [Streptomyces sp. NPDC090025]|uniref:FMN-binding protein n=1 Tax=Streptomyces sp. NPDC090025 TaxID=3365922 RepID=UPI003833F9B6